MQMADFLNEIGHILIAPQRGQIWTLGRTVTFVATVVNRLLPLLPNSHYSIIKFLGECPVAYSKAACQCWSFPNLPRK